MPSDVNNNTPVPNDDPYYEKLASEEEIYLEEIEEELRAQLISDSQYDPTTPSIHTSSELPRQAQPDQD